MNQPSLKKRLATIGFPSGLLAAVFCMAGALVAPASASAAEPALAVPLCSTLVKLLPEVRTYRPEGARAQLVMAIAEKFDYDAAKLRQVKLEIDRATAAGCPKEREAMLELLKMKSLADAVS